MEKGRDFQIVLKEAQDFGWAEADPSMDVDRKGIRDIKSSELQALKAQGKTIKLICEGYFKGGKPYAKQGS